MVDSYHSVRLIEGKRFSNTPYTTLKMAVVAPIPNASVIVATAENPGYFPNVREAYTARRRRWSSVRRGRRDFCAARRIRSSSSR